MSTHNPELQPPHQPAGSEAIQPGAPDFVETPEPMVVLSVHEQIPLWLYVVCAFALFMAGSSFTGFGSFGLGLYDQGMGGASLGSTSQEALAPPTPLELGKKVYGNNCASCHQPTGEGQPGKYPPVAGSEWVVGSKERLAAIILHGLTGPVTVKGASFGTDQMAAWQTVLTSDQIANVMTYLRGTWGNTGGPVTPAEVDAAKAKFASQTAAYGEADLLKIAPHGADPTDAKK